MSIYKRKETWWVSFTSPGGERIQQSAGTKNRQEAQELHDRLKAGAWRVAKLGARETHTWQEAVVRWCKEKSHKGSIRCDISIFRWLDGHLGGAELHEIGKPTVDALKKAKLAEGASNATANRMLALLRSVLNAARDEWDWIEKAPPIKLLPEPQKRLRWLGQDEAASLLSNLPPHLAAMAQFALATGLRESNVTGLKWEQVDLRRKQAWVHADQSKNKKALPVPLNESAMAALRGQIGKHAAYVFTYKGRPVGNANTKAWRNALKKSGIDNFRFHDLRHTWASWHVQNGTPLHALQELGGWSSITMVQKYAHLGGEHLSAFADNAVLGGGGKRARLRAVV